MYFFLVLIFFLVILVISIFAFPRFSPIPYFPSNGKDIPLIIKALNIRKGQTIIDLGAGDGVVILRAEKEAFAKKLNTTFVAVEINPILLFVLHIRRFFHPNRKNIHIRNADMFTARYSTLAPLLPSLTFYIYISPWFIDKTVANIQKQIPSFDLVSYFYIVASLKDHKQTHTKGVHDLYSYTPKG